MGGSFFGERQGGERGNLSSCDPLTGLCWLAPAATDEAATAGVARPVLLQVLERAGVTTGRVVHLHCLVLSSAYQESWNYKQLSDNCQHEPL